MAFSILEMYLVVHRQDIPYCTTENCVPLRYVSGGRGYIGLRERKEDALERAKLCSYDTITHDTHRCLKIYFSALGFAHYASYSRGAEDCYTPVLSKVIYKDTTIDWKVWRFFGDLPLSMTSSQGQLLWTEWEDIQ